MSYEKVIMWIEIWYKRAHAFYSQELYSIVMTSIEWNILVKYDCSSEFLLWISLWLLLTWVLLQLAMTFQVYTWKMHCCKENLETLSTNQQCYMHCVPKVLNLGVLFCFLQVMNPKVSIVLPDFHDIDFIVLMHQHNLHNLFLY